LARYGKDHKSETRRRIVSLASRRFRAEGVDGVGIASLMAEAGLTNGGFYAHFASKEDLVKQAVLQALSEMPADRALAGDHETCDLPRFIDLYLSCAHRDHPESGCALATMAPDLVRRPDESRSAFEVSGMAMIDRIATGLSPHVPTQERRSRALTVFAHLLGTLQLARFVTDKRLADTILAQGRTEALHLAGMDQGTTKAVNRRGSKVTTPEA
jgi:TetR/AcrR family transcriptional regulator, transcriptional repressor for nem operon